MSWWEGRSGQGGDGIVVSFYFIIKWKVLSWTTSFRDNDTIRMNISSHLQLLPGSSTPHRSLTWEYSVNAFSQKFPASNVHLLYDKSNIKYRQHKRTQKCIRHIQNIQNIPNNPQHRRLSFKKNGCWRHFPFVHDVMQCDVFRFIGNVGNL